MEDPPIPTSPTAGYTDNERLVCLPYARKFNWEDDEHIDNAEFYSSDEEVLPNTFETVKRFLRQVRESKGYDVDCCPPLQLGSPFMPLPGFKRDMEEYECVMEAAELVIGKINADFLQKGITYKLVDVEKVVLTRNRMYFLTFTAKEVVAGAKEDAKDVVADTDAHAKDVVADTEDVVADADASVKTFQALVYLPYPDNSEVLEWKFKPGVPDANAGVV